MLGRPLCQYAVAPSLASRFASVSVSVILLYQVKSYLDSDLLAPTGSLRWWAERLPVELRIRQTLLAYQAEREAARDYAFPFTQIDRNRIEWPHTVGMLGKNDIKEAADKELGELVAGFAIGEEKDVGEKKYEKSGSKIDAVMELQEELAKCLPDPGEDENYVTGDGFRNMMNARRRIGKLLGKAKVKVGGGGDGWKGKLVEGVVWWVGQAMRDVDAEGTLDKLVAGALDSINLSNIAPLLG